MISLRTDSFMALSAPGAIGPSRRAHCWLAVTVAPGPVVATDRRHAPAAAPPDNAARPASGPVLPTSGLVVGRCDCLHCSAAGRTASTDVSAPNAELPAAAPARDRAGPDWQHPAINRPRLALPVASTLPA